MEEIIMSSVMLDTHKTKNKRPLPITFESPNKKPKSIAVLLCQSSSKTIVKIKFLRKRELLNFILNPETPEHTSTNIVQLSNKGRILPFHIPDLSDLSLLPKPLKVYFEWLIGNATLVNLLTTLDEVLTYTSHMPNNIKRCTITGGEYSTSMHSSTDEIRLVVTHRLPKTIRVALKSCNATSDGRDGRVLTMKLIEEVYPTSTMMNDVSFGNYRILIWNCKGLSNKDFPTRASQLIDLINPDILIVAKSRVSNVVARWVLRDLKPYTLSLAEPQGVCGGIAVLTFNNQSSFKNVTTSTNELSGLVLIK